MIAVTDRMKVTSAQKKRVPTSNLRVHEQVIVYHSHGSAMVMMIASINKMKKIARQYHVLRISSSVRIYGSVWRNRINVTVYQVRASWSNLRNNQKYHEIMNNHEK